MRVSTPILCWLMLVAFLASSGCVIDRTGTSGSYLLKARSDSLRDKARSLERDLAAERARVDSMEERAADARRRYADSGATVQALMEDLNYLRGEVATVQDRLQERDRLDEDLDYRLGALEATLSHVEDGLLAGLKGYEQAPVYVPSGMSSAGSSSTPAPETDPEKPDSEAGTSEVEGTDPAASSVEAGVESRSGTESDSVSAAGSEEVSAEDAELEAVLSLVEDARWKEAGGRLQRFLKKNPSAVRALEAQYLFGRCLFELARFKPAITELQKVISRGEDSEWAPRAMFLQGMSFVGLGTREDRDAAEVFFAELVRLYPKSAEARKAKKKMEEIGAN